MRYKVLFDNILIKLIETEEDSSIIIDTDYQNNLRGRVVEIGNGLVKDNNTRTPMEVRPDMTVWFKRGGARKLEIEGEDYYVLPQSDILLVES